MCLDCGACKILTLWVWGELQGHNKGDSRVPGNGAADQPVRGSGCVHS